MPAWGDSWTWKTNLPRHGYLQHIQLIFETEETKEATIPPMCHQVFQHLDVKIDDKWVQTLTHHAILAHHLVTHAPAALEKDLEPRHWMMTIPGRWDSFTGQHMTLHLTLGRPPVTTAPLKSVFGRFVVSQTPPSVSQSIGWISDRRPIEINTHQRGYLRLHTRPEQQLRHLCLHFPGRLQQVILSVPGQKVSWTETQSTEGWHIFSLDSPLSNEYIVTFHSDTHLRGFVRIICMC